MDVFRSRIVVISYNASTQRLTQRWYGFPASDDFRLAIDKTVEFCSGNSVSSVLSDTREQDIILEEDSEYAARVMPELVEHGLKAFAFILSGKEHTRFAVNNFSRLQQTNTVRHFTSEKEAHQWLDEMAQK